MCSLLVGVTRYNLPVVTQKDIHFKTQLGIPTTNLLTTINAKYLYYTIILLFDVLNSVNDIVVV